MTKGQPSGNRSGSAPFRAHARLIRLLGEELISDEVMAVVELVKNSYDADARQVTVSLDHITDPERGHIRIVDNGSGMSLDTVLHSWLEPASSQKRARRGEKARTTLGRVLLGEKGIGRFAVDKLGSELELVTRPERDPEEMVLRVRWHHFDQDKYLDEVENTWQTRMPREFVGTEHGTALYIQQLRNVWDEDMVTRLHDGLLRLISPYAADSEFIIEIQCSEFPEVSGRVINKLLDTAPYRLAGTVDQNGIMTVSIPESREIDLRPLSREHFICPDGTFRTPRSGPFTVSLNVWDLEPNTDGTRGINNALRKVIKSRSGVSIYRDSFRIWPYGERDDDWLELNQRRVNNPTLRISNNQVIGFIEISHAGNSDLRDRTSREGLLDTPAFFDLKALVAATLSVLETERFERRRTFLRVRPEAMGRRSDPILRYLSQARNTANGSHGNTQNNALVEVERLYREQARQEQIRYSQVARLAGAGMAAELMTDAFSREISNAMTTLHILNGESRLNATPALVELIGDLTERMERINEHLDTMKPLYQPSAQDSDPITVRGVVYDVLSVLNGRLAETGTRVRVQDETELIVRMNRGHLMQVFMILLENSLTSMQEANTARPEMEIQIASEEKFNGVRIVDSGPGVPSEVRHLIFEPYFSTRAAGRGLGLKVARDILSIYTSSLDLIVRENVQSGACFEIRFDGRRVSTHV